MKKTFTKIIAGFLCCTATTGFAQLTPEVLYYNFNGSGTTVPNLASNPPVGTTNATIMGGVTQGGSGICQGTLIGSGVSSSTDYLNTGWAPNLGSGAAWTISFRTSGISTNATLYYIFGDAGTNSFRCFTNGVAGSTNWILRGGGVTDSYINGGALSTPTMCTYVYDPSLNQIRGYLNGVLVSTTAQGGTPNLTGTGPFKVMGYSSNVGAPAGGMLDEFRFYSRALTAAEIAQLYNPFVPSGFLGSDVTLCNGDSIQLQLNWPYSTALWSTGSTSGSTWGFSPDTVSVSLSGTCGTGMDTLIIRSGQTSSSLSTTNCTSYLSPSGNTYTSSGTYMDTLVNSAGCDSVITINLTIIPPTTSTLSATVCDMYTAPSGAMFMSSGTYMDTIPNMSGCDSVITINLTVNMSTSSTMSTTTCGNYTAPSGAVYTSSGMYMDTIPNMSGCDSVITINLTVNSPSSSTMSVSACDSYTAPSGMMITSSGTFMDTIANVSGCDSVITINASITYSTSSTLNPVACSGSYTAPSGAVYSSNGTYMDTIPNMAGCDSVITINLTMGTPSSSTVNATSCGAYTAPSGAIYSSSGTYMDTITNMTGCDSVITINLTVNTVNTGITQSGITLTASASGATYQWINCAGNTPIAGATSQSYTATANGNYAVVVTQNNCTDTSSCLNVNSIGMAENTFGTTVRLYPNPSQGEFFIDLGAAYHHVVLSITDMTGRQVYQQQLNAASLIPVALDQPAGVYFINLQAEGHRAVMRIVKQ